MTDLHFSVEGDPVGKGRARSVTRRSKIRGSYIAHVTPEKTRTYEAKVKTAAIEAMQGREIMGGPLFMSLCIYMPVPTSWSKKKRDAALIGEVMPITKPDASNVLKAVEDAMNGVVYIDDSQITDLHVRKRYSAAPRVDIIISPAR